MKRILVAMSGGVDSSVAALLLVQQGFIVEGAYMKNWMNEEDILGLCPWQLDIDDARAAADAISINFEVVNFMKEYRENIVSPLVEGYRNGLTPNPDVMCNRKIKFGVFLDYAKRRGFNAVATGHYCQKSENDDRTCDILEGADKNKDQSYFLAMLEQVQIQQAVFPVGHLQKSEVRALARRNGLPNADKKDSQGICFVGQVRLGDFLGKFIPDKPGNIVDPAGLVLGRHRGIHRYTMGQRKGIGIPSNSDHEFYVVVGKNCKKNHLIVAIENTEAPGLYTDTMNLHRVSFTNRVLCGTSRLLARPRYRDAATNITYYPGPNGGATVHFHEPQRALAPGQICAFYEGEKLIGGGVFC